MKPGAYPVPTRDGWWRPPHVHFSLFGKVWLSRLVTQMYFPGEPLNAQDRILNAVPDAAARDSLVARYVPPTGRALQRARLRAPDRAARPRRDAGAAVMIPTGEATIGPFFPPRYVDAGANDLTVFDGRQAQGRGDRDPRPRDAGGRHARWRTW